MNRYQLNAKKMVYRYLVTIFNDMANVETLLKKGDRRTARYAQRQVDETIVKYEAVRYLYWYDDPIQKAISDLHKYGKRLRKHAKNIKGKPSKTRLAYDAIKYYLRHWAHKR